MIQPIEYLIVIAAVLLLLSILASKISLRLGIPALILFLVIGMLAGSDGPGGIYFDDAWVAQAIGVVALAFILFSGGLDTDWKQIRPTLKSGLVLATVGVFITAAVVAVAAHFVLGLSWLEGALLGAIISSTDAAAVFAVLRSQNIHLKGKLAPLIELESGINDPMAVFLTIGFTTLLTQPDADMAGLLLLFVRQMVIGVAFGYLFGRVMLWTMNNVRLENEGLYSVLTITFTLLIFGVTAVLGGSGFLAVYLAGLVLGNHNFVHRRSLIQFHDGLAWLMQIAMFLTLGLLVFPSQLMGIIPAGLFIAGVLTFLARPISIFIGLAFSSFNLREKLMISWVGLRGAVPIILATFPLLAGIDESNTIFNVVFFVVLTSVLLQGTTIGRVAKWLGLEDQVLPRRDLPLEFVATKGSKKELTEITLMADSAWVGQQLVSLNLPEDSLIVLIGRGEEYIVPRGGTILEKSDVLLVLSEPETLQQIREAADYP